MTAAVDGRAPTILTEWGARKLTQRIRAKVADALDLIVQAWEGRAWEALDYPTWDDYLAAELPEVKAFRLPIDTRRDAVAAWSARGMSQRAMAAGLNVSPATIAADVAEVVPHDEDATVVSLDGRQRKARVRRERPAPEPPPAMTKRDRAVQLVAEQGDRGLTVKELCALTDWPQTTASGTLTPLERQGRIRRVSVFRLGCAAYIVAAQH
ncbi:helix-turn-helix domain-containing protein [Modestobacter lapidis]|nr:helix-turn-helix domain-containing protein [Modestobacter lapidis]